MECNYVISAQDSDMHDMCACILSLPSGALSEFTCYMDLEDPSMLSYFDVYCGNLPEEESMGEGCDGVHVNHVFDNPGFYTCDCVDANDQCLLDAQCVVEPNCPTMDGQSTATIGCDGVHVNHVFDNPGFYTCDCVDANDQCLLDN